MTKPQAVALGKFLEGKSVRTIAKECGVSKTTIMRWMNTLDYRAHLEQAQQAAITMGRTRLTANADKAVRTLVAALDDPEITKGQVTAAIAILDRCGLSAKLQLEYESLDDALKKLPADQLKAMLMKRLEQEGEMVEATEQKESE